MRLPANDARDSLVMGHRLEVYLSCDERWSVAVDEAELESGFAHPYAAWAAGAAESYRLGRVATPALHEQG